MRCYPDNGKLLFTDQVPKRLEMAGHYLHFDNGTFEERDNYVGVF